MVAELHSALLLHSSLYLLETCAYQPAAHLTLPYLGTMKCEFAVAEFCGEKISHETVFPLFLFLEVL